jgi:ABC-2 type transport system ATP-binding protein
VTSLARVGSAAAGSADPAAPSPAVSAIGLTKHFGRVLALDRVNLEVPEGSVFGLLGPNGAGKTTALRILVGLSQATSGSATVAGVPVALGRPGLRRRIGYLAQDPRFYSWMTGRQLLELVGRLHGLEGADLRTRVHETLDRVALRVDGERRIGTYSGGMRQRLGVAQALLPRPPLIVLDEPAASLDPEGRRELLQLIAGLRGTSTVLFSSHILADVERICDRVAILDRGRLVIESSLPELLAAHVRPVFRLRPFPGQDGLAEMVTKLAGEPWASEVSRAPDEVRVTVSDDRAAAAGIMRLAVEGGVTLEAMERVRPTLEDVFLELVTPPSADELDARGFVRPREVAAAPAPPAGVATAAGAVTGQRSGVDRLAGPAESEPSGFSVLLRKELVEQWRTMHLPLAAAVFALVGFSSPLVAWLTPAILAAVGSPELSSLFPTPTTIDAVAQLVKNLGQFGALTAILLTIGSVAGEVDRGTAALILSQPAARWAFLAAKVVGIAVTLAIATAIAMAAAWFYTLVLFGQLPAGGWLVAGLVEWLSLLGMTAIAFLASTVSRSVVAAAGLSIVGLVVVAIVGFVPSIGPYVPTGTGELIVRLTLGLPTTTLVGALAAGAGLVLVLVLLAWLSFRRQEL